MVGCGRQAGQTSEFSGGGLEAKRDDESIFLGALNSQAKSQVSKLWSDWLGWPSRLVTTASSQRRDEAGRKAGGRCDASDAMYASWCDVNSSCTINTSDNSSYCSLEQ
jgi:hypothetical protein